MREVVNKEPIDGALVQSPFIPGTTIQFAWDSTSLSTALECPRRYQLRIIEGWRSKSPNTAIALAFGILVHTGVEEFYIGKSKGLSHDEAVIYALKKVMEKKNFDDEAGTLYEQLPVDEDIEQKKASQDDDDDGIDLRNSKIRTRYYLWRALVWYFEQYRNDPMEVLILPSGKPAVEYSFRVGVGRQLSDGTDLILAGHIDRLVTFNKQVFVSDVKTTKSISRQYFAGFDLSHQMTGYTLGGKIALSQPVSGVVIDAMALQVGGVQYARHFTNRTDSQLDEYIDLLAYVGAQAEMWAMSDYYPMNTSACLFCEFKSVCSQPPELRAGYLNYLFERKEAWNPLKSR